MASYERFLKARKSTRDARRTSRSSRKGGGASFSDRWFPPKASEEDPQNIVLFPGEYKMPVKVGKKGELHELERQYYLVYEHGRRTANGWRSTTCSAGLALVKTGDDYELSFGDDTCAPCYHIDDGSGSINRRLLHVFNAARTGWFHLIDSENVDKSGQPYKDWVECEGKRCKHCSSEIKKIYGRRVYWPMGKRFIDQLLTHAEVTLSNHCKCGGELETVGFQCEECGEIIRDLEEDPADKKELKQLRVKKIKCPNCKVIEAPEEIKECDSCREAAPLDIWDVVYTLYRSGEGTDSSLVISDWKRISPKLAERLKKRLQPYDFANTVYRVPTPSQQAQRISVPNPFKDDDEGKHGGVNWDSEKS